VIRNHATRRHARHASSREQAGNLPTCPQPLTAAEESSTNVAHSDSAQHSSPTQREAGVDKRKRSTEIRTGSYAGKLATSKSVATSHAGGNAGEVKLHQKTELKLSKNREFPVDAEFPPGGSFELTLDEPGTPTFVSTLRAIAIAYAAITAKKETL
jgi:hypothetical protein